MTALAEATSLLLVCPQCQGALAESRDSFACSRCGRRYPVLFGIPDFRLDGDRYLSLAEERAKAQKLADRAGAATFEQLVDYYYSITDDVPPGLARAYAAYVHDAPSRAAMVLGRLGDAAPGGRLLDIGCGSGGLLLAARGRFAETVGVDIALRWLVICRKRLLDGGVPARLICADLHALPFAPAGFDCAVAMDVVEHTVDPDAAIAQISGQLKPGGRLWLSASNRFGIGPHPTVGLWGIGFLPAWLRTRLLRWRRGVDSLRNVTLVSPWAIARICARRGLDVLECAALEVDPRRLRGRGAMLRHAAAIYATLRRWPLARQFLLAFGPAFQVVAQRRDRADARPEHPGNP